MRECIFSLCNIMTGTHNEIRDKIVTFENGFIMKILGFGLKCFNFKYENVNFLSAIIYTIKLCIICSEIILIEEDNYIKKYIIEAQIDEYLNKLQFGELTSEVDKRNIEIILDSLKDNEMVNNF